MIEIKHKSTGAVLHTVSADNLRWANLREANLRWANLRGADLRWANLRGADLRGADLRGADLRWANLREADLRGADLRWANLRWANLREANLRWANLREANLSGATGVLRASAWMADGFARCQDGYIVYRWCGNTTYPRSPRWPAFGRGVVLEECPNPDRGTFCGCGVHFATLDWCSRNSHARSTLWRCLLRWEDLADVVVPFGTDGKARCARLELLEPVE